MWLLENKSSPGRGYQPSLAVLAGVLALEVSGDDAVLFAMLDTLLGHMAALLFDEAPPADGLFDDDVASPMEELLAAWSAEGWDFDIFPAIGPHNTGTLGES